MARARVHSNSHEHDLDREAIGKGSTYGRPITLTPLMVSFACGVQDL